MNDEVSVRVCDRRTHFDKKTQSFDERQITGKVEQRMKQAKHYIDTLGLLEEKTAGHRSADESTLLTELLHQLRMGFVMMRDRPVQSDR